jgi:hypothetical protein
MHGKRDWIVVAALALLSAAFVHAQAPIRPVPSRGATGDLGSALAALGGDSTAVLAGSLRGLVLSHLPNPLYEDLSQWGMKKLYPGKVHWRGKGLRVHAEVDYVWKNDGHWKMIRVTAIRPQETLVLNLRDVQQPEPGRMQFTVFLALDTQIEQDRQVWRQGVRFRSSGLRARMRCLATLRCEVVTKLDSKGGLLPDLVFRMRVLQASVGYDNLVVEHVAGIGGDGARLLGAAVLNTIKSMRPSLEQNLMAKANAAIVRAADTKEIRISVLDLMGKGKGTSGPGSR